MLYGKLFCQVYNVYVCMDGVCENGACVCARARACVCAHVDIYIFSNASDINVEISVRFIYLYNSFSIIRILFKIIETILYMKYYKKYIKY